MSCARSKGSAYHKLSCGKASRKIACHICISYAVSDNTEVCALQFRKNKPALYLNKYFLKLTSTPFEGEQD